VDAHLERRPPHAAVAVIRVNRPTLVIVCGAPGTGKTTLARHLAAALSCAILTKDDLKEALADELGSGDRERSRELGRLAYEQLFARAGAVLGAGAAHGADHRLVVEANFHRAASEPALRDLACGRDAVVIECVCDAKTRRERFAERRRRGARHPVHLDEEILANEWSDDTSGFAIDIGSPRLVVDTSRGYAPEMGAIEAFAGVRAPRDNVAAE
ncbi:MAG: AAA family ATPase, partial [Chloroflexota bacterium]|nr:AAA family ATPase [Chloroflexota bacterium]